MMKQWFLGEIHPIYGEVVMMGVTGGEPYRWFRDKYGGIAMIPLFMLQDD